MSAREKFTAIVLAAGKGTRMHSKQQKVYMELLGKPVLTYSLTAFENSEADDIVLVAAPKDLDYVKKEIVEKYGYKKISRIVPGGEERHESVYAGLLAVDRREDEEGYVLIHDSARAFITSDRISDCMNGLRKYKACVMGMPVKDTIRIADEDGFGREALDRRILWQMQTPQCFIHREILAAYAAMRQAGDQDITDDVMVMERYGNRKVKLLPGGYDNIKITTAEDMLIGEAILRQRSR